MSAEPLKDNENVPTITLRIRMGAVRGREREGWGGGGGGGLQRKKKVKKETIMTNAFCLLAIRSCDVEEARSRSVQRARFLLGWCRCCSDDEDWIMRSKVTNGVINNHVWKRHRSAEIKWNTRSSSVNTTVSLRVWSVNMNSKQIEIWLFKPTHYSFMMKSCKHSSHDEIVSASS